MAFHDIVSRIGGKYMKKNHMVIFILLCALPLACYAFDLKSEYDILLEESNTIKDNPRAFDTDKINFEKTPINKLGRGVINLATCWAEVIAECFYVSMEKDPMAASRSACWIFSVKGARTARSRSVRMHPMRFPR